MTVVRSIRGIFVVAVSFGAATIGDSVLEGTSNSGLLWHGHYTDNSSLDLLPTCAFAVLALLATLWLLVREQVSGPVRALMYSMPRALSARCVLRVLPAIAVLQLGTLWAMETTEQTVVYGHPLGGLLWLGAPAAIAVLVHAIIGSASAFAVAAGLTLSARHLVRVIRSAIADLITLGRPRVLTGLRPRAVRVPDLHMRSARRCKRGPPTPAASTI